MILADSYGYVTRMSRGCFREDFAYVFASVAQVFRKCIASVVFVVRFSGAAAYRKSGARLNFSPVFRLPDF
jgi:hypothetical protein